MVTSDVVFSLFQSSVVTCLGPSVRLWFSSNTLTKDDKTKTVVSSTVKTTIWLILHMTAIDSQSRELSRLMEEQVKRKKDERNLADKQVVEGEMKHKSEKPLLLELPRIPLVSGLRRQTHDHLVRPTARPQSRPARTGLAGWKTPSAPGFFHRCHRSRDAGEKPSENTKTLRQQSTVKQFVIPFPSVRNPALAASHKAWGVLIE